MAQLKQVCTVTNGSQTISVIGVNVAYRILKNSMWMNASDLVPYVVAADATFDGTNTVVKLTGAYQGVSSAMTAGVFVTDFTVPDNLPLIAQGDVGTAAVWTAAMNKLQAMMATLSPAGLTAYIGQMNTAVAAAQASQAAAKTSETNSAGSASAAATSRTNAGTSETNAAASKTAAAASAAAALASQQAAKISETNSKNSETNAGVSASGAAADRATVQGILATLNALNLGMKTSDPTKDNNGNALIQGAEYFNTTTKQMRVYTASGWQDVDLTSETMAANATASASAAAGSASASASSATSSDTRATAALASQNAAKTSETNSKTSEINAKTSESNAKASEGNAKTSETNAAQSAQTAQTLVNQIGNPVSRGGDVMTGDLLMNGAAVYSQRYASAGGGIFVMQQAGGSLAAPTATAAASMLGQLIFKAYDGAAYRDVAAIESLNDAAVTSTASPGYLRFSTTAAGSVTRAERMRITSAGRLMLGSTTDDGANILQVTGNGKITGGLTVTGTQAITANLTVGGTSTFTGAVSGAGITGTTLTSTGAVNGVTGTFSGALGVASLAATGAVSGTTLSATSGSITASGYQGNSATGVLFLNSAQNRYLYFDGSNYNLPGTNLIVNGGTVWHSGNLSPMPLSGGVFSGQVDHNAGLRVLLGNRLDFFAASNSYGASIAAASTFVGFLNQGASAWNMQVNDNGVVTFPRARPNWAGLTPWDTGNFNPSSYQPVGNYAILNVNNNSNGTKLSSSAVPNVANASGSYAPYVPLTIGNGGNSSASAVMLFIRDGQYAAYLGMDTDNQLKWGGYSTGNVAYTIFHSGNMRPASLDTNATFSGYVQANGSVGINVSYGFLTSSGATGTAGGTIPISFYAPNGRVLATEVDVSSDRRLKANIEAIPVERALKFVTETRAITHTWKAHPEVGTRFGFIAQDVSKGGFDELISLGEEEGLEETVDDDGFVSPADHRMTLNYQMAVPLLTAALKHAFERIAALEAKTH